jgi:ABC-type uncharacterized transport system fused permease/ATPase subunit
MARWRQVLADNAANFRQEEDRQRMGNVELAHQIVKVAKIGMGRREIMGLVLFCSLFFFKSVATWNRIAANSEVLEAFAFGTNRRNAVVRFGLASLALAAVESTITHVRFWLIASIREALSKALHKMLMGRERFARAKYEPECEAATAIPHYCGEFAEHLAELPYYFLAPSFDAAAALLYFWRSIGGRATKIVIASTFSSLFVIRQFQPDLARLHARVITMEGAFQKRHFTVQERAEAIAMASGSSYFYDALNNALRNVYAATCRYAAGTANFFLMFRVVELAVWEMVPLLIWLTNDNLQGEGAVRTLVMQRDAVRRFTRSIAILFKNTREISHLKEFTAKLSTFVDSLHEVDVVSGGHDPATQPPRCDFALGDTLVEFTDVCLKTPANIPLNFYDFSLRLTERSSWMVRGANGTGKTAMYRTIKGLWPLGGGRIRIASDAHVLTLPQQAFHLHDATLREQLYFPQRPLPLSSLTPAEIADEERIAKLSLKQAQLEQIGDLIGGWENSGFVHTEEEQEQEEDENDEKDGGDDKQKKAHDDKKRVKSARYHARSESAAIFLSSLLMSNPSDSANSGGNTGGGGGFSDPTDDGVVGATGNNINSAMAMTSSNSNGGANGFGFGPDGVPLETVQHDGAIDFLWSSLSGGQSQKLALARVFFTIHMTKLRQQKAGLAKTTRFLLLLDESTSQVDSDAEDRILGNIRSLPNVTLMHISHRKQGVSHADHVLVIGETRTPQIFTAEEFMARLHE